MILDGSTQPGIEIDGHLTSTGSIGLDVEGGLDGSTIRGLSITNFPGGGMILMIACETTDLPEPDSPTRATVEPAGTANETPSTARKVPAGRWKSTRTCPGRRGAARCGWVSAAAGTTRKGTGFEM